jgi:hypothetical protein
LLRGEIAYEKDVSISSPQRKKDFMSKDHHSDGQKDAAEGKYNTPHSITPLDTFIHSDHDLDKWQSDNDQYDSGYSNANKQK